MEAAHGIEQAGQSRWDRIHVLEHTEKRKQFHVAVMGVPLSLCVQLLLLIPETLTGV